MTERLQKFIAGSGITSRRKAEELISAGRVFVNGKKIKELGTKIDPQHDKVTVDGHLIPNITAFRYIALNKPTGVTCTRAQYKNEKTVHDLVPGSRDLVIAGRLDKDSDGLVLLTNDGELVNKLTHPRYQHQKEYEVTTPKPLDASMLNQLRRGIRLEEGRATFDSIDEVRPNLYRVILHQGWKRQIRRMFGHVHNDVLRLHRIRINRLAIGDLKPGEWREVQRADII